MKEEKKAKYREKFTFKRKRFVEEAIADGSMQAKADTYLQLFLSLPEAAKYRRFASYIPLLYEADVSLINKYLKDTGKKLLCILPKVSAPIPKDLNFDIVIVPLLAFDKKGHRLGQGGGWYDRFIKKAREVNPNLITIGFAFAMQEMADAPVGELDEDLDIIITDKQIIRTIDYNVSKPIMQEEKTKDK